MQKYSAFKKEEILTHAVTWMILKDIVLKEKYDSIYMRYLEQSNL